MNRSLVTTAPAASRVSAAIAAALFTLACGCAGPPSAPTPLPAPQDIAAAPTPTSKSTTHAALVIESFEWRLARTVTAPPRYLYTPSLVLREAGGTTAVTLDLLFFMEPGGGYTVLSNAGCFRGAAGQIDAGGTWSSTLVAYYCLDLDSTANFVGQEVRVLATFRDALGEFGQVTGTTIVTTDAMSGR